MGIAGSHRQVSTLHSRGIVLTSYQQLSVISNPMHQLCMSSNDADARGKPLRPLCLSGPR